MQNHPRTEFEWQRAHIAMKHGALVLAREGYAAFAPGSCHLPVRRTFWGQLRLATNAPNHWSLPNEKQ